MKASLFDVIGIIMKIAFSACVFCYFECNHMLTRINSHITKFSFSNYGKCVVLVSEFMPNVPEFMPNVSK